MHFIYVFTIHAYRYRDVYKKNRTYFIGETEEKHNKKRMNISMYIKT